VDGQEPVRLGYTMADLHRLACIAVKSLGPTGADWSDYYEIAWGAIAERLYVSDQQPSDRDLIFIGRSAIYDEIRSYRHHYGYFKGTAANGAASSPRFWQYWYQHCFASTVNSCEDRVVDEMALAEILSTMDPVRRDAIVALAVWDEYHPAAIALGITYRAFIIRLNKARADFRRLWHEGETPSKMWGSDQRVVRHASVDSA